MKSSFMVTKTCKDMRTGNGPTRLNAKNEKDRRVAWNLRFFRQNSTDIKNKKEGIIK